MDRRLLAFGNWRATKRLRPPPSWSAAPRRQHASGLAPCQLSYELVTDHLVGAFEIAGMLGVSRQRVHQLAVTSGFPWPVADLASGRVWKRQAVEEWARRTGRLPTDDDGSA